MRRFLSRFLPLLFLLSATATAAAREVVDLAGRTVKVPDRVERIILGEGRFLPALAIVERGDPLARVVGMMGDFPALDPGGYAHWLARFPKLGDVPRVGKAAADTFSAEQAVTLAPDLAIFGAVGHGPGTKAAELIAQLEAAGVTVAFVDFFRDPLINTPKSVALIGALLGREAEAAEYTEAYAAELAKVRERVASATKRPRVFLENRVGLQEECCASVGKGVVGDLIEMAGGINIGAAVIPGPGGVMSLEYLLANPPDVYVGTAIGSAETAAALPDRIALGPGVSADLARATFSRALARPAVAELDAVRAGKAHALWHHFFHSPFNVVALQAMARWFQPDLTADLDPRATLDTFFARFQPVAAVGDYWIDVR